MNTQIAGPIVSDEITYAVELTRTVTHQLLEDNLAYFAITHSLDIPVGAPHSMTHQYPVKTQRGFARPADVVAFLDENTATIPAIANMYLVPRSFKEQVRTVGFGQATINAGSVLQNMADLSAQFQAGNLDLDDIVILDIGSHRLMDRHGTILPSAIAFSYIDGGMKDGCYDLEKALVILANDARVSAYGTPSTRKGAVDAAPLSIEGVPYYNAGGGCSQTITFMFAPTAEDMKVIYEKSSSYSTDHPMARLHRAVFDLDLLGLRAGGAAKFDNFGECDDDSSDDSSGYCPGDEGN